MEDNNIIKSIAFDYGLIELRADKILTYIPNKDIKNFTLPQVKQLVTLLIEVADGEPKLYYCDISNFSENTDSETKAYMKSTLHLFASGCACVLNQNAAIIIYLARMYLFLYKPEIPTKLFFKKTNAITWLKSLN